MNLMGETQKYTAEDLLIDDQFLEWIHSNEQQHNEYWQDRLLNESPPFRLVFDQAKEMALALSVQRKEIDVTSALQQLQAKINEPSKTLFRAIGFKIWRVAAAIFLLLSLSWFFWPQSQSFQTDFAEIQTFTLPDKTVVTLRANSKLWWEGNWEQNEKRIVYLEGEAYFDVRPMKELDIKRPFVVHAMPLEVEVLGTEFNLVNRPTRSQVVLVEGKVSVTGDDQKKYELKPQQKYAWDTNLQRASIQTVDPSLYTDWQQNIWRFDDIKLSEAAVLIKEQYGKSIVFANPKLKNRKLNGSAPASSLEILLKGIETSLNISIINEGDRIIFND